MINRNFFFNRVRLHLFGGSLRGSQVEGVTGILDEWERSHSSKDDRWLAYMLATAHHETDRTIKPIKEYGGVSYYTKMYDPAPKCTRPALARSMGNTTPGDGPRYCGRGFVQLTWKNNYAAMSAVTGVDLVKDPDRTMELPVATKVLFHGMMNGSFTGKKLANYFNKTTEDWKNARRIINDLDKATAIAEYAKAYYSAISHTT
jgi:putative chitinase